jgi:hypothetical protein
MESSSASPPSAPAVVGLGLLLFLPIPVVLFLFVVHPRPLGWSLATGVALMLAHRFVARPYMRWAAPRRCLWCGRVPPRAAGGHAADGDAEELELETGAGSVEARCCAGHGDAAARFFAFVHTARWPLRLGIFVPLLLLLGTLAAAAAGRDVPVEAVTDLFRLLIGVTVNVAAWGYLAARPARPARVPFPVHNFFLLGVAPLLWVFRLVGIWWIWLGARGLLGL